MKKTTIFLMLVTILSKIFGFLRDIALSYFYGASYISDAYIISTTIPGTIFAIIGAGIATNYIPVFTEIKKEVNEERALSFTSNLLGITVFISTIIILVVLFFTAPLVKIFASGFDENALELVVLFTRISIVSIYFTGIIYILTAYLQIKNSFLAPVLATVVSNIIVIISIILSVKINIQIIAIGTTLSLFVQLVTIAFVALHHNFHLVRFNLQFDKYITKLIRLSIPVIIGVSVAQVNVLVDRTIASQISSGGISAMNYAYKINGVIHGVFIVSIASVIYPIFSKLASENGLFELRYLVRKSIIGMLLLVIPITFGLMIFSKEISALLFNRGSFDEIALSLTSDALFFYAIGLAAWGLTEILVKVLYSLNDTKSSMITAGLAMLLNIILNLILSKYLGIGGLALATSISMIFRAITLIIVLYLKIGSISINSILVIVAKSIFASTVMAIISLYFYERVSVNINPSITLILSIILGAVIYLITIILLKIEEVDIAIQEVRRRINDYRLNV